MPLVIIDRVEPVKVKPLVGHILITGKSGSGKSNTAEYICTNILEKGKTKVFDTYDNGRFENMLYGFPETDPYKIQKTFNLTGQHPKAFKNQIIAIPGGELRYNQRLPKNVQLMSFNIEDLDIDDLFYLLGSTEKLQGYLASISNIYGEHVNMKILYEILIGKRHGPSIPDNMRQMAIRNLKRWFTSGIFSDKVPKIDFVKIAKEVDTITSFTTFLQDTEQGERIVHGLIDKKLNDIKRRRLVDNRILVYKREISSNFQPGWEMSRKYILDILRQGRDRGLDLICDMQRIFDIDPTYRRQFGLIIMLRTDYEDAEKIKSFQGSIPTPYLLKAPSWGAGEGMVLTGATWEYPFLVPPTRHAHKNEDDKPFEMMGAIHGFNEYTDQQVDEILRSELIEQERIPSPVEEGEGDDIGY